MSYTGVRLKYRLCRLAGVSGYSDVVALGRKVGVQHIPGAKNTKKKFVKPCEFCCCSYHCNVLVHEVGSVEVDRPTQQVEFPSMLDRSYMNQEDYEEDIIDHIPIDNSDPLLPLLCALHTDLKEGSL